MLIEQGITKSQLNEFNKLRSSELDEPFWCTCQGWLNSADDTIISRKAYVKLACKLFKLVFKLISLISKCLNIIFLKDIDNVFEWEPMATSGLIGKSVEIRCLPPDADPKPTVKWLKNNVLIEKSNKRIIISNEGSLLINEVRNSDAANYTCIAENLAGKVSSDSALLTVTENKGWTSWSNWTECVVASNSSLCGEGSRKRTRICLNPPTINNAIGLFFFF